MNRVNLYRKEFEINSMILKRMKYLEEIRNVIMREYLEFPEGNLSVAPGSTPNSYRYYNRESSKEKTGKYLDKTNKKLRDDLAQKKYYGMLLKKIDLEYAKLKKMQSLGAEDSIISTYKNLNPGIRRLINPINIDDTSVEEKWIGQTYHGLKFNEFDTTEFFSEKGERMRSKSEVLIANALLHRGIPYKYEYPLVLSDKSVRYPDFTILNARLRKLFYWEHLGRMGDLDYVSSNIKKLNEYKKAGIFLGNNLIVTIESVTMPLSTKEIERIIENVLGFHDDVVG